MFWQTWRRSSLEPCTIIHRPVSDSLIRPGNEIGTVTDREQGIQACIPTREIRLEAPIGYRCSSSGSSCWDLCSGRRGSPRDDCGPAAVKPGTATPSTNITTGRVTQPASSSPLAPIRVDQVQGPPLCAKFTGSGDVPSGKTLWLVVQSDEPKYYFFPTIPEPRQHRWIAENVTLGIPEEKPGEPFTVFAMLASPTGDKSIEKLNWGGSRSLPSGVEEEHRIYVKRGKDNRRCSY